MQRSTVFATGARLSLPEPVTRYFTHALAAGAPLTGRIQVRMHGRIRVGGWLPFHAREIIDAERGFRWEATVAGGLFRGYDLLDRRHATTHFALLGRIPLANADGPDIVRSAGGVTVPARGRVGWWYGTDRWSEFFRFAVDDLRPC